MSDFKIGQKVVHVGHPPCGKPLITRKDISETCCHIGSVYTIRWIGMAWFGTPEGVTKELPACRVDGVIRVTQNPLNPEDITVDVPYGQAAFRPLVEEVDEASVEVFRKIARDVTAGKVIEIVGK